MNRRRIRFALLGLCALLASCGMPESRQDETKDQRPETGSDADWHVVEPEEEGFEADRLARLTDDLRQGRWGNVHALLISRHGRLFFEEYFEGSDELLGDPLGTVEFGPDSLHDVRSISKTVTALLVGIALDAGLVSSVNAPLSDLLPDHGHLLHGSKSELTLHHVLTMSTGLLWDEDTLPYTNPQNDERRLSVSDDPVAFVLSRDLVATPGKTFQYSGGATLLLARILDRATGETLDAYARRVLFEPLGIQAWHWGNSGHVAPSPYAGLRLTAPDLAKIGQVFGSGGSFAGRRIVSEDWIRQATRAQIAYDDEETPEFVVENGYGYQMWWNRYRFPTGIHEVATGVGNGEQRIIVVPHLSLVVTVLGGFYNDPESGWLPEEILMREILPAFARAGLEIDCAECNGGRPDDFSPPAGARS